jgi:hypothetical protein
MSQEACLPLVPELFAFARVAPYERGRKVAGGRGVHLGFHGLGSLLIGVLFYLYFLCGTGEYRSGQRTVLTDLAFAAVLYAGAYFLLAPPASLNLWRGWPDTL